MINDYKKKSIDALNKLYAIAVVWVRSSVYLNNLLLWKIPFEIIFTLSVIEFSITCKWATVMYRWICLSIIVCSCHWRWIILISWCNINHFVIQSWYRQWCCRILIFSMTVRCLYFCTHLKEAKEKRKRTRYVNEYFQIIIYATIIEKLNMIK